MTEAAKKKSGAVKPEDFEDEVFAQSLAPLSQKLQEQFPNGKFDVKSVNQFTAQIQQLTEDVLGIKSLPPRPFPKPPVKIFRDVNPDGSLHVSLAKFHQLMTSRGLRRVDFSNPYHRRQFQEMLVAVITELVKKGLLKYPKVFLHPSCGAELPELRTLVQNLKGELAPDQAAPGITHIVKPFGAAGDPDDGVQYMRNLLVRGQKAKVHWWYYPDSYDEYVALDDAPEVIEPDKPAAGPWIVYSRWIRDSAKYNEWMNPIDYEVDDTPAKAPIAGSQTDAAKPADGTAAASKTAVPNGPPANPAQQAVAGPLIKPAAVALPEVAPNQGRELQPGLLQQQLIQPDLRATNHNIAAINIGPSAAATERHRPVEYAVPQYAHWFDSTKIDDKERAACPFLSSKNSCTKQDHLEVRNAIIAAYKLDPGQTLTVENVVGMESGTAQQRLEIWKFLDEWGIINFTAYREAKSAKGSAVTADETIDLEDDTGKDKAAVRGLQRIFKTRPLPDVAAALKAASGKVTVKQTSRKRKREDISGSLKKTEDTLFREDRFFCNVMPEVECTNLRYHCTKIPDLDLCPKAWANGLLPAGTTFKDFIRLDRETETAASKVWNDQDTLLLLEGLELFKDNWADIADHVGKSQVQCVSEFLRLPLEDAILDDLEWQARLPDESVDTEQPLFVNQDNPLMALVALTSSVIGPQTGSAAAKSALQSLTHNFEGALEEIIPKEDLQKALTDSLQAVAVDAKLQADCEGADLLDLASKAVASSEELVKLKVKDLGRLEGALQQELSNMKAHRANLASQRPVHPANVSMGSATQFQAVSRVPVTNAPTTSAIPTMAATRPVDVRAPDSQSIAAGSATGQAQQNSAAGLML